jgi:hypothetical protein
MFHNCCRFGFLAIVLIVLGVLALLTNLGWINSSIWQWWPVLIIGTGIYLLVIQKRRKKMTIPRILERIASDEKVQEKLSKIINTVDEVVDKKLDEWHKEVSHKKPKEDEDISGEQEKKL